MVSGIEIRPFSHREIVLTQVHVLNNLLTSFKSCLPVVAIAFFRQINASIP